MVLAYQDIMEVVRVLSEDRNMVVTVRESGKGALVTGGVAGLGKSSLSLIPDPDSCLLRRAAAGADRPGPGRGSGRGHGSRVGRGQVQAPAPGHHRGDDPAPAGQDGRVPQERPD